MSTSSLRSELSVFLGAALRNPAAIGAPAPSSGELGRLLASVVPTSGTPTVLELGAGTGSVSAPIAARLPQGGRHLAVELDPVLGGYLATKAPGARVLCGDVAELDTLLAGAGHDPVSTMDAVVSGLPWSLFGEHSQRRILGHVCRALAPGAGFTTFAYRHAAGLAGARRFRALLHEHFDEVVLTRTVWRNVPPALVYLCRRPVRRAPEQQDLALPCPA